MSCRARAQAIGVGLAPGLAQCLAQCLAQRLAQCLAPGLALCLALGAGRLAAQPAGDSLVISVLTMGPGRAVYERFGHISIRVHDLRTGMDSAYNWGMFDFSQPRFLQRFLTGDTRYWMEGFPTTLLVDAYRRDGRWVVEQELALTRVQADSLWRFIRWNAREENRWYRYDYYLDNCSTRVRDVLDLVLGGAIRRQVTALEHGVSFRGETLRLAAAHPLLNFGMDFALGPRADATISAWEEMFVPMRVRALLREVRVRGADGVAPLVRAERQLVLDDRYAERTTPPDLLWPALAAGLGVAAMLLLLALIAERSAAARWGIGVIAVGWHAAAGVSGLLLLAAGLFTRHVFMGQNPNVLLATPVSLALAVLVPLTLAWPARERLRRAVRALAVLATACALAALALRFVPSLAQENRPLLALALPIHGALALALWRATRARAGGGA